MSYQQVWYRNLGTSSYHIKILCIFQTNLVSLWAAKLLSLKLNWIDYCWNLAIKFFMSRKMLHRVDREASGVFGFHWCDLTPKQMLWSTHKITFMMIYDSPSIQSIEFWFEIYLKNKILFLFKIKFYLKYTSLFGIQAKISIKAFPFLYVFEGATRWKMWSFFFFRWI